MGGTASGPENKEDGGGLGVLNKRQSRKKAKNANQLYRNQKYEEALKQFKRAIELRPSSSLYHDRAATYVMLREYPKALDDVKEALKLDRKYIAAYLLEAKCHIALGDVDAAILSCRNAREEDPDNESAKQELRICKEVKEWQTKANDSFKNGDFTRAALCYDECIKLARQRTEYWVLKAEALSLNGKWTEAEDLAKLLQERGHEKTEALYILAHCFYYKSEHVKAFEIFEEILKMPPPTYQRAKETYERAKRLVKTKRLGDEEWKVGHREEAVNIYSEALNIDPLHKIINSKIYCNRGFVYRQMEKCEEAIADLTKSIELHPKNLDAYIRRAKCYIDCGKNSGADEDYEAICKIDPSRDHKNHDTEVQSSDKKKFQKMLDCPKCYRIKAKRKKVVQEIMNTEISYGEDLIILKEEFYEPLRAKELMKQENLDKIFLNLDELILVNTLLRSALKVATDPDSQDPDNDLYAINIGSLFLDSATTFQTFERYIVNQAEASEVLERKEKRKDTLKTFLNDIQQNRPRVRRMQLQSFLLVPVQRIMKYPLLLDRLYNATPDHHKDKEKIKQAKEKIESILREVDEKAKMVQLKAKKKR